MGDPLETFPVPAKVGRIRGLGARPPKAAPKMCQHPPDKYAHTCHLAAGLDEGQESERLLELRVEPVAKIEWHPRLAAAA